jgi:nucleoid DNA-binding protein
MAPDWMKFQTRGRPRTGSTLTASDLAVVARDVAGVSKQASEAAVLIFTQVISEALDRGDVVMLRNYFQMHKTRYNGRSLLNLKTMQMEQREDSFNVKTRFPKDFLNPKRKTQ